MEILAKNHIMVATLEDDGHVEIKFDCQANDNRASWTDYVIFSELSGVVGREVRVSGQGPTEAYAGLCFHLVRSGAIKIITNYFNGNIDCVVFTTDAQHSSENQENSEWFLFFRKATEDQIEIQGGPEANGYWPLLTLQRLYDADFPEAGYGKKLVVTGKGTLPMYATLGCLAARHGYLELHVDLPRLPYLVAFHADGRISTITRSTHHLQKSGVCIGILGDPNSGKSVFSRSFYYSVQEKIGQNQSWIYDCDMAAPTPAWYLQGMTSSDEKAREAYQERRRQIKKNWSPEKEKQVSANLANLKANLRLVIADMPGGRHPNPAKGENFPPQRITGETRGHMMQQCDAFIVLCRQDKPTVFEDWLAELREHGITPPVLAKVVSANPEAPVAASSPTIDNGLFTFEINGLNRKYSDQELVSSLRSAFLELLDFILERLASH